MIEIALSLAIIAFGMVAIIGVLPSGMTVQRDNRRSIIINEDAQFWLNAIRNGLREGTDLVPHVQAIHQYTDPVTVDPTSFVKPADNYELIGRLSRPFQINRARLFSLSSPASQKEAGGGLEYVMFTTVTNCPVTASSLTNLWDLRLVFAWPIHANGEVGALRKTFRTLVQGSLESTNNLGTELFFFNNRVVLP
ncbi:MAG: hypothetical protein JXQ71_02180 [Verrucomicrobia bacterium]|nr:hypothetical protein [Verrucomicrobiota bacterium]